MSAEADMRSHGFICVLGTLLIGVSTTALAQNAITARPLHVRAGPDRAYPLVAQLDAGAPVDVMGCLNDWSWCDVAFDGTRGWAYGPGLTYVYQGQDVPLYAYAPGLGIPVVSFSLDAYWGQYYQGRPWYGQRTMWMHRRLPAHRRPPGPAPSAHLPPLHAQTAQRGPAEHAPAGRTASEHASAEHGAPANIRSADRRGEQPTSEKSNEKSKSQPNERQEPDRSKREPPPG
jgi:uncharacterized protein YraI